MRWGLSPRYNAFPIPPPMTERSPPHPASPPHWGREEISLATARAAAVDWLMQEGRLHPGYLGAYLAGSTVDLPDAAVLPTGSDLDLNLVVETEGPKPGKRLHQGVLLDITVIARDRLFPAERALASYHLAGGFRTDTILDDPTDTLRALQREVAAHFAEPVWVRRRLEDVKDRILGGLRSIESRAPWPDQVTTWLFATGVTAHLLLVAGLKNPTVRLRYLRARELLAERGMLDRYPALLDLLGSLHLTQAQAHRHLNGLARAFDAAAEAARTPFFFSSDITPAARPIAIDASRTLIEQGDQREAMFWIVATYARCHKILADDAPAIGRSLMPAFAAALADLGIGTSGDLIARGQKVLAALPGIQRTAEEILRA